MDFWLIVVIAFAAALVIGFGFVILRGRADAVRGPSVSGSSGATTTASAAAPARMDREALDAAVGKLLTEGQVVPAVELIREQTGLGLRQAMQYAQRLSAGADAANAAPAPSTRSSISSEAMAQIQQLVAQGKKIQAIKLVREHTGLGLEEAKDLVDRMADSAAVAAVAAVGALDAPAPATDQTDEVMARIQALVADGKKIQAIKLLLENAPDFDLRRAKEIVDRM